MEKLAQYVAKELKKAKQCAVYEEELSRVWPQKGKARERAILQFARSHGWRLRFFKDEFCAIFDKPVRGPKERN